MWNQASESHVETRAFPLTNVQISAVAMTAQNAILQKQVSSEGFFVCILCKYNHTFFLKMHFGKLDEVANKTLFYPLLN